MCYNIRYAIGSSLERSITMNTYQTFEEYIYMINITMLFIIKLKILFSETKHIAALDSTHYRCRYF